MQANKQNCNSTKQPLKRTKSITRYPKNVPTYVVAFAMHETYDDLMTAQQMICKKSPQGSINSVTPTNSLKILEPNAIEKYSHIIDMTEDNDVNGQSEEANKYVEVEKTSETETLILKGNNNSNTKIIQPEVIFNAAHVRRTKDDSKFRKRSRKNKRVTTFGNVHFKCKHPQKMISRKLDLYCTKSKGYAMATDVLEQGLCNLSNVVTQSRVLKKVLAVEDLLGTNSLQIDDVCSNDGMSSFSSSTTKKGVLSHSSDNTITRKWSSISSKTDDYSSINTDGSVLQVSSENVIPYKNDIINVAVAVAFNKNKANEQRLHTRQFITRNEENYLASEDLTSTETVILPHVTLTSTAPSYENSVLKNTRATHMKSIKDASSDDTLVGNRKKSSLIMSIDEDTFVIARTSSDFNKSTLNSDSITNSETQSDNTIQGQEDSTKGSEYKNKKLLDTVINLGFFPEATPSTSKLNTNAVIITKEHKTYTKKEGETIIIDRHDLSKNILKKTFDFQKNIGGQRIINLPDEAVIRAKLKETHESQRKIESEFQSTQPSTLAEMWGRLIQLIDSGLRRIEETLPEKIVREIKRALDFDEYKNFVLKVMSEKNDLSIELKEKHMLNKGVCVDMIKTETDESLQCDLVQNQVIDQLMMKLYPEGQSDSPSAKLSQKLITKIFKEYFEVVSPVASEFDIKEDVTISGTEPELAEDMERFRRFKILLSVPLRFVKENAFVMTTVPTFFILLLSMYGLVIFIMKPL